ncbi:MAG TPA: EamA family transporter [Candidatus Didemnitutus sp.]|nr:EamA family transporter [Candidatus Didemnitutus sp.]
MYLLALVIATVGAVVYHVSMKQIPANLNPFYPLIVAYLAAAGICTVGLFVWPDGSRTWRDLNPAVAGVALGVVGIETGFLLAYRAGWNLGYANLAMNACSILILAPLAWLFFRESLSPQKLAGMGLCLAGLVLLVKR